MFPQALVLVEAAFDLEPTRRLLQDMSEPPPTRHNCLVGSFNLFLSTNCAYRSNCNVKLTAAHRLKPSSNAKSHVGSITSVAALQSKCLRPLKTRCDESPHEQDYYRANDCADKTSALASLIPSDRLPKVRRYKSSNNPKHGRPDEPGGFILISRINQFRDYPCHKPNYDGPKNTHCDLQLLCAARWAALRRLGRTSHHALDHHGRDAREHGLG